MQELNVGVTVERFPETVCLDIAGLSSESEFKVAIKEKVGDLLSNLDEVDRSNIELGEELVWEVTFVDPCDEGWVFEDSLEPKDWLWGWVEYFGKTQRKVAEVCKAAAELSIAPDKISEAYVGEFPDDESFAEAQATETGAIDAAATWPNTCIDWEWASRELMMDYSEENGHYFRLL